MVMQNRKNCYLQGKNPLDISVCNEVCQGEILTIDDEYKCPFNGDELNSVGLENVDKLTATEKLWLSL